MPFYELVYITRPDLAPNEVDELGEKFRKILEQNGGKLASREYWGLRNLAYRINKNNKGHYVLFNIEGPFEAVKELERNMKFDENVVRKVVFKLDKLPSEPSELAISINAKDKANK